MYQTLRSADVNQHQMLPKRMVNWHGRMEQTMPGYWPETQDDKSMMQPGRVPAN
jgi:hypothetical protein